MTDKEYRRILDALWEILDQSNTAALANTTLIAQGYIRAISDMNALADEGDR